MRQIYAVYRVYIIKRNYYLGRSFAYVFPERTHFTVNKICRFLIFNASVGRDFGVSLKNVLGHGSYYLH